MMSTVKFKTTTNNNDNFQRAVASMLKGMHSSTNHNLDITQTSDDKIIIQPMSLGGWGFNIDVVNKKPKEKKVYHLHDDYNDTEEFVKLGEDFVEFLEWLKDHDFMTCEFEYEDVTDMPMPEF